MKTLDEVIEELQYWDTCDKYPECFYDDEVTRDALQYLKDFKRISAKIEKIALGDITETLEKLDNPALTWEELETMEGKPIWVEYDGYTPDWEVIEYIGDTKWKWGEVVETHLSILHKESQGKTWQAYRKERKLSTLQECNERDE